MGKPIDEIARLVASNDIPERPTGWREIDDHEGRGPMNPWPWAIGVGLFLWGAIFWAAQLVVILWRWDDVPRWG